MHILNKVEIIPGARNSQFRKVVTVRATASSAIALYAIKTYSGTPLQWYPSIVATIGK